MFNNASGLHNEKSFYKRFLKDLGNCKEEAIIESPFITAERMKTLRAVLEGLVKRGVRVYIITRDPKEQGELAEQAELEIQRLEILRVQVFICEGNHHRKLAILDRQILWEGSLNILSQSNSREIMRRIENEKSAENMFNFLRLGRYI